MSAWLTVIGIGDGGLDTLTPDARRHLDAARTVFGGERHLSMLMDTHHERIAWRSPLSDSLAELDARRGEAVAVLASGDPLWFGIGATLARRYGLDALKVIPSPSAFSLAAARLGWPLQDVACLSAHGRPIEGLVRALHPGARLLVLTEDADGPAAIAALLTARGYGESRLTVLEHLGGAAERVRTAPASSCDIPDAADLNLVAVECRADPGTQPYSPAAGLPDEAFVHDGKMTKRVLRTVAIAALAPQPGEVLWDVGAGCGSIAVEWCRAVPDGRALAIEPVAARRDMIAANADRFCPGSVTVVEGVAPAAYAGLARPDGVFVGGGLTDGVFDGAWEALRPGGRMVAHAVTLESEAILLGLHRRLGGELLRISVEQASPVGAYRGWRPAMPVLHWHLTKPEAA
ncbi:precorrin-6y C5,15-methyltransferase (decarboxylating) subunit CbiE [Aurantimonas sp. MSK8Z-1]|uniref:precorrin-6y C5,15-methyltransferase (decarboxylating) subunit CbiE n=1 Tax=Mangrovibrevibacter kandeliae TaxID=2968473 RepID=UPI00222F5D31|nr:precorrin-6y C5,15-methyltransferase (decarboxylating) subunit CbiE [Aurantimonas sp. MSK8Z-1]MCW4117134.1 precorrin-6y C5,15-methyltransferase (decarboxylating) subunit CbiE [Aurantimonas sp. MSK8Z-1]